MVEGVNGLPIAAIVVFCVLSVLALFSSLFSLKNLRASLMIPLFENEDSSAESKHPLSTNFPSLFSLLLLGIIFSFRNRCCFRVRVGFKYKIAIKSLLVVFLLCRAVCLGILLRVDTEELISSEPDYGAFMLVALPKVFALASFSLIVAFWCVVLSSVGSSSSSYSYC